MHHTLTLGSHISVNKKNKYLLGAAQESLDNGATTLMIFTGAPQNKRRIPIADMYLKEFKELWKGSVIVHAPYICNLANDDPIITKFNIDFLSEEIQRSCEIGASVFVLHPGFRKQPNHIDSTHELKILSLNLLSLLDKIQDCDITIALETMAGKNNQIGSLEELSWILKFCNNKKLSVCLDTCHMHDYGYDLNNIDIFCELLQTTIGNKVSVVHLGDSMNKRGSRKDRHANLGYGHIGFECLLKYAYHPLFYKLPIIIETPFWKGEGGFMSPYKHEISLIKNQKWAPAPHKEWVPIFP